ncbi:TIGR03560 family F420-dependent LLM class oxidoreductase [Williamsia sp.]|uniref:TIGR03560 family F420-dependent LLM class oxidoreductase n=1 Tax=Williamsia sp. TaxID=1872085 RepID=UPI001A32B84E|nr:TIGR03560 family F420-dependent LLM class oxidoreductase [Williamsia sp.]MBJ7288353.1 TIGR03560 family F420-dependent LLM class oxidoreductase [Williamsia sp.]
MSIRLGYQIPNFTYPGTPADIVPTVLAQAREAEANGFDTVLVMDHFYQLPGIGKPEEPMLEAYTLLAAIAAATESVQLSTLVTGNTYRNPAMLAKTVTTLDLVSAGRAVLAIGAGWYELEHQQMGYEFGTFTDRFERLDEALQIIEPMLRGRHPEVDGKWYQAHSTLNEPRVRDDLPIMLGGGGEKKTFGLAARYADHLNIICNASELPRKLDALAQRCEEAGRDRDSIETSFLAFTMIDEDGDAARKMQREYLIKTGVDYDNLDDDARAAATDRMFVGSPDEVAEQIQRRVLDVGVDGVTINLVPNGHIPGVVELAGKTLAPLVAS